MDKLSVKNKEVRALCKITEEKESELCSLRQKLTEQECKYSFFLYTLHFRVIRNFSFVLSSSLSFFSVFSALLAEAMKVAEDAGNAPQLREENLALHKENVKIRKELEISRKSLEDSEARFKVQHEKDASVIRDMETALRDRLKEIEEMDKHLFGNFSYYAFST